MERRDFLKKFFISILALSNIGAIDPNPLIIEEKKKIYLTVDDGPKKIESILNQLKEGSKVTFFMIGELLNARYFDACTVLEKGHIIGNHSHTHPEFSKIPITKAKKEIEITHQLLEKIYEDAGIKNPMLFRFPYFDPGFYMKMDGEGFIGDPVKKKEISNFLKEIGYKIYNCNIDTEDWRYYTKQKKLDEIIKDGQSAKENDIILIHELPISISHVIPAIEEKYKSMVLS